MKKVFQSNKELCHIWAQCIQDEGRANSLSFYGTNLKSYSTSIAKIYPEKDSCLFSYENYSNTTAKHLNYAHQANNTKYSFTVPSVDPFDFSENIPFFIDKMKSHIEKALRATKYTEHHFIEYENYKNQCVLYSNLFGCNLTTEQTDILHSMPDKETLDKIQAKIDRAKELEKTREIRAKEKAKIDREKFYTEYLPKWKSLEIDRINTYNLYLDFDYLRIKEDKVETTQGAVVSLQKAKFFAEIYKQWLLTKDESLKSKIEGQSIDYYEINSIDEDFVKIGCHTISKDEILTIFS